MGNGEIGNKGTNEIDVGGGCSASIPARSYRRAAVSLAGDWHFPTPGSNLRLRGRQKHHLAGQSCKGRSLRPVPWYRRLGTTVGGRDRDGYVSTTSRQGHRRSGRTEGRRLETSGTTMADAAPSGQLHQRGAHRPKLSATLEASVTGCSATRDHLAPLAEDHTDRSRDASFARGGAANWSREYDPRGKPWFDRNPRGPLLRPDPAIRRNAARVRATARCRSSHRTVTSIQRPRQERSVNDPALSYQAGSYILRMLYSRGVPPESLARAIEASNRAETDRTRSGRP